VILEYRYFDGMRRKVNFIPFNLDYFLNKHKDFIKSLISKKNKMNQDDQSTNFDNKENEPIKT